MFRHLLGLKNFLPESRTKSLQIKLDVAAQKINLLQHNNCEMSKLVDQLKCSNERTIRQIETLQEGRRHTDSLLLITTYSTAYLFVLNVLIQWKKQSEAPYSFNTK